jgi:hypothetical protein
MARRSAAPLAAAAVAACLIAPAAGLGGVLGVDVSTPVSPAAALCMAQQHNVTFGVARAWHSYGAWDDAAVGTLAAWQAAGFNSTDVYFFPCVRNAALPPSAQIAQLVGNLTASRVKFGRVWLDIETNTSPGCAWGADKPGNCAFLQSLLAAGRAAGLPLGVYATMHMWLSLVADAPGDCAVGGPDLPLWYAHYQSPSDPSFDDFVPFGGWPAPAVKQFADTNPICGVSVDDNWAPAMP